VKSIAFDWSANLTDITVSLTSTPAGTPTTALAAETSAGSGTYVAQFSDDVTGAKSVKLKRGSRVVAGNAVVTMPAAGGTAYISARATTPLPVLLPTTAFHATEPVAATDRVAYTDAAYTHEIPVRAANRDPIPMAGKNLQWCLMTLDETIVAHVDALEVTGDDENVVVIPVPADAHATAGDYIHAVRDLDDGNRVWIRGCYTIKLTAGPSL